MKMPDFPKYCTIELTAGQPFFHKKTHSTPNPRFFAALYLRLHETRFYADLGFLSWEKRHWAVVEEHLMQNALEDLIFEVARDYDVEAILDFSESVLFEIIKIIKRKTNLGKNISAPDPDIIPLKNVLLRWNPELLSFEIQQYSPELMILNCMDVEYQPEATAPKFEAVVKEIIPDPEDRRVIQEYLGAALFFVNRTRRFLLCYGEGGCGKSVLILFLVGILGKKRVFDLNVENIKSGYELSALTSQTLLTASEAVSRALCTDGAEWVKKSVGGDFFQTKQKFRNEKQIIMGLFRLLSSVTINSVFSLRVVVMSGRIVLFRFTLINTSPMNVRIAIW